MEQSSQTVPARRQRRPWTEEDQRQAEEMQAQGATYGEIGRCLKRSYETVRNKLDPAMAQACLERNRAYRQQNREMVRERAREYYESHRAEIKEQRRQYHQANREKDSNRVRLYYEKNKEKVKEKQRHYRKANTDRIRHSASLYRKQNADKLKEERRLYRLRSIDKHRAYIANNREKVRERNRRHKAMRRSARRSALSPVTLVHKKERFDLFNNMCAYCGKVEGLSVDHVLALCLGGLDEPHNIAPACNRCNCSKNSRPVEDWYRRQSFFTEERWRKIQRHCPAAVAGQLPLAFVS